MFRPAPGPVENLLPTRDSRGNDLHLRPDLLDRRKQALPADSYREVVVLSLEAEGARHAAATCIDLINRESRDQAQGFDRRPGPDQRLLMAVAVDENPPFSFPKRSPNLTQPVTVEERAIQEICGPLLARFGYESPAR